LARFLSFRPLSTGARSLLLAFGVLFMGGPPPALAADPVAVIASVKGRVDISPAKGGPAQRAVFGRPLERGDKVAVSPGGAATIFFNDGNVIELAEKSAMTVGGRATKSAGAGLPSDVDAKVAKFVTAGSRQTGLVAMSELRSGSDDQAPILLVPRRTYVLTDRPAFAWRAVEGATRYRVTLSSAERGELWTRETSEPSLAYPEDVAALASEGEYLWEVDARDDLRSLRQESSVFQVLSAEQARAVKANLERIEGSAGGATSAAAHYLAGSYLAGLGLYDEAVTRFVALGRLDPGSPAAHEALGSVYTKVGLMDLAAAEFQQALALTRTP
jgi:hypothetical protein